ncbi:MAG TPA: glycosyltransferase family A protein, partial [Thermoanaerobaculia bacterium]
MNAGLVSTIIPVYNRAALVREAVASVVAQTHRPIEIIVVDDGSTDDTAAVVDALAREHAGILRAVHIPNGGPGRAREAGRALAHGEFIQYLDSDDVLLPKKFELQVAALRAHSECDAAYGWTRELDAAGNRASLPRKRTGERIETMFPSMLTSRWWDTLTPLYRSTVIDRAGAWTDLRAEEDWEYDCRIAAQGVRLAYVADWICEVR